MEVIRPMSREEIRTAAGLHPVANLNLNARRESPIRHEGGKARFYDFELIEITPCELSAGELRELARHDAIDNRSPLPAMKRIVTPRPMGRKAILDRVARRIERFSMRWPLVSLSILVVASSFAVILAAEIAALVVRAYLAIGR